MKKAKKGIIGVGIITSLALAMGATAYATEGFDLEDGASESAETSTEVTFEDGDENDTPETDAPEETEDVEELIVDETEETSDEEDDAYSIILDEETHEIRFKGPETVNEVEFKANYLPAGYTSMGGEFGETDGWNWFLQCTTEDKALNINVYYASEFGDEGSIYLEDNFNSVERTTLGEYEVLMIDSTLEYYYENYSEFRSYYNSEGIYSEGPYYYDSTHYIMYHPDGYVIYITSDESFDVLEQIASNLEIRETGNVRTYDPDNAFFTYGGNGVG